MQDRTPPSFLSSARRLHLAARFSLLAGLTLVACTAETGPEPSVVASALESAEVVFNVPDCLPNCTAADQARYVADSRIESDYVSAIDAAREQLVFSMFTFSRAPIYEALVRAATRGVVVRGIMDRGTFRTTGSHCTPQGCSLPAPFDSNEYLHADVSRRLALAATSELFSTGSVTDKLVILLTNLPNGSGVRPAPGADRLVHNKLVLVDGERLLTGSGNWSSTAVSVNLENVMHFDVEQHAAVVGAFTCALDVLWTGDGSRYATGLANCQKNSDTYFTPATRPEASVIPRIVGAIDNATTKVDISMHHLTHGDVFDALERALGRGVRVRLAMDDDDCNASEEDGLTRIREAGAEIRYVPTTCSIFQLSHSKYGVIDDTIAINGSGNWSKAGLRRNYENFVVLDGAEAARPFVDNFAQVWRTTVAQDECACDTSEASCIERYCVGRTFP
jgi:phosphatidylserine/phosphatidylglycerophosphate/cardiolipin synthase-like enzyme